MTLTAAQLATLGLDQAGSFPIAAEVTDTAGTTVTATTTLTVTPVLPTITVATTPAGSTALPFGAVSLDLTQNDPGAERVASYSVNWGDGTATQTFAASASATLTVTHTYLSPATYAVAVAGSVVIERATEAFSAQPANFPVTIATPQPSAIASAPGVAAPAAVMLPLTVVRMEALS